MASKHVASVLLALFVLSVILAPTLLPEAARISPEAYQRKLISYYCCDPSGRHCKCCPNSPGCIQEINKP